jgi:hypothetical protein
MEYNDQHHRVFFNPSSVRMITKTRLINHPHIGYNIIFTGGELEQKDNQRFYEYVEEILKQQQSFMKVVSVDRGKDYELFVEITISIKHISAIHLLPSNEQQYTKMVVIYLENVVHPSYFYFHDEGAATGLYYQLRGLSSYETITPKMFKLNIKN